MEKRTTNHNILICSLVIGAVLASPVSGEGGLSGSGFFRGALQRFASIVLNDVELQTGSALIVANGVSVLEQDLRIGQQLEVTSSDLFLEQVDLVSYRSTVLAPVESIDLIENTLTLLGQTAQLFVGTNTEGTDLADLVPGNWVELSGQRDNQRTVLATFLQAIPPAAEVRLIGQLDSTPTGLMLLVDGTSVDANTASGTAISLLTQGDRVQVVGSLSGSLIQASNVLLLQPMQLQDKDYIDVTGFISSVNLPTFDLDELTVVIGPTTTFVNGQESKIADDVRIEVEGALNAFGQLSATRILFKPTDEVKIRALVQNVDITSGIVQVLGINIQITSATKFGNSNSSQYQVSSIDEISVGDYLRVRAFVDGEQILAARIDGDKIRQKGRLEGLVSAIGTDEVNILGAIVAGDENTEFELDSEEVTQSEFFAALNRGDRIRVKWEDLEQAPTEIKQE